MIRKVGNDLAQAQQNRAGRHGSASHSGARDADRPARKSSRDGEEDDGFEQPRKGRRKEPADGGSSSARQAAQAENSQLVPCRLPPIRGFHVKWAEGPPFQVSLTANRKKRSQKLFPSFACVFVSAALRGPGSIRKDSWESHTADVATPGQIDAFIKAHRAIEEYSRGHLIARAYFGKQVLSDATFVVENMVPQYDGCNNGWWQNYVEKHVREVVLDPTAYNSPWDERTRVIVGTAGFDHVRSDKNVAVPLWMWTAVCRSKESEGPTDLIPAGSYFVAASASKQRPPGTTTCGDPWPPLDGRSDIDLANAPDALQPVVLWLQENCQAPFFTFDMLAAHNPNP
eukprot:CAMPEP_0174831446 /NCGR_PEP_ID=MMETSP1114-20130205/3093_1 /TAXON_ID=312471 /ORGANISM="Neobodo designis, Strain CCAP 1951/1" /LENGTH=341 /DNA_ID=CAMNT_0016065269 /DNA_START=118 /DNA_END=1143 /DNA_ORIENTATION=-